MKLDAVSRMRAGLHRLQTSDLSRRQQSVIGCVLAWSVQQRPCPRGERRRGNVRLEQGSSGLLKALIPSFEVHLEARDGRGGHLRRMKSWLRCSPDAAALSRIRGPCADADSPLVPVSLS